jgi:hypothetical protein
MTNQILIVNSVILTLFVIVLDHIFIEGHITPLESLNYEYIDDEEIKKIEKQIKKEKRKKRKERKNRKEQGTVVLSDDSNNALNPNGRYTDTKNIDEKMLNELGYITGNHPTRMIEDHRDYVDIYNNLDNTAMPGKNFDVVDQFDFNVKAYNE